MLPSRRGKEYNFPCIREDEYTPEIEVLKRRIRNNSQFLNDEKK